MTNNVSKPKRLYFFVKLALLAVALTSITSALAVDWLGLGYPGFGLGQLLLATVGSLLLVAIIALRVNFIEAWITRHRRFLAIALVWLAILISGLTSAELYARHLQGWK